MPGRIYLLQKSTVQTSFVQVIGDGLKRKPFNFDISAENMLPYDSSNDSFQLLSTFRSLVSTDLKIFRSCITVAFQQLPNTFGIGPRNGVLIQVVGEQLKRILSPVKTDTVTVKVQITNLSRKYQENPHWSSPANPPEISTADMAPQQLYENTNGPVSFEHIELTLNNELCNNIFHENGITSMEISILLSAELKPPMVESRQISPPAVLPSPQELVSCMQNMLENKFQTDTIIVAANGTEHECHKIILAVSSPVFEAMLSNENFEEGKTRRITIQDMSEVGIRSLLQYLYYLEVKVPNEDFDIAMELLEASEKYSIDRLKTAMTNIILGKKELWKEANKALRIFCFSNALDDCKELKNEAVGVLKSLKDDLMQSEEYANIFKKTPSVGMELCNALLCSK